MKQADKICCFATFLLSFVFMGCASTDKSARVNPMGSEQQNIKVREGPDAKTPECVSLEPAQAIQDNRVVRLLAPPFMTPKDDSVLPQEQITGYAAEPYVLRYQVVEVNVQLYLDFLQRESEITDKECWAKVQLNIFDEEPIVVYRDNLVVSSKHVSSNFNAWAGRSRGNEQFSFQFVIGPEDAVTMKIESKSKVFQVNWTDSLPYHVLWEWDTNFFGSSTE